MTHLTAPPADTPASPSHQPDAPSLPNSLLLSTPSPQTPPTDNESRTLIKEAEPPSLRARTPPKSTRPPAPTAAPVFVGGRSLSQVPSALPAARPFPLADSAALEVPPRTFTLPYRAEMHS
jgi:hypothetical protein